MAAGVRGRAHDVRVPLVVIEQLAVELQAGRQRVAGAQRIVVEPELAVAARRRRCAGRCQLEGAGTAPIPVVTADDPWPREIFEAGRPAPSVGGAADDLVAARL